MATDKVEMVALLQTLEKVRFRGMMIDLTHTGNGD